jgi:hypothetical protein
MTKESNLLLYSFLMSSLAANHHSSKDMCISGSARFRPTSCRHRNQTSLANTQCLRMCCAVSSSWRQVKHALVWSCSSWLNLLSPV